MDGSLLLTPVAIFFLLLFIHRLRTTDKTPSGRERSIARICTVLCASVVLVSLIPWYGMILAMRFDWSKDDAAAIEVAIYDDVTQTNNPNQTILLADRAQITAIIDGIHSSDRYESNHEHSIGTSYALRLQRESDGQWSPYRVMVFPNRASAGELVVRGAYVMELTYKDSGVRVGPSRTSAAVGRLVESVTLSTEVGSAP